MISRSAGESSIRAGGPGERVLGRRSFDGLNEGTHPRAGKYLLPANFCGEVLIVDVFTAQAAARYQVWSSARRAVLAARYAVSIAAAAARPSSAIASSRMRNFWTLPVTVVGNSDAIFQ